MGLVTGMNSKKSFRNLTILSMGLNQVCENRKFMRWSHSERRGWNRNYYKVFV